MATNNYTIKLPESAIIVSDWNSLRGECAKLPNTILVKKYGGYVIEVDEVIKVATGDNMTDEVDARASSLPPLDDGEAGETIDECEITHVDPGGLKSKAGPFRFGLRIDEQTHMSISTAALKNRRRHMAGRGYSREETYLRWHRM